MAFNPIDQNDIEVGKPVKQDLFQTTKDNFDDHEARIASLAQSAAKVEVFIGELSNLQQYSPNNATLQRVGLIRASRNFRIINAQIYVLHGGVNQDVAPTAGTLEIDVLKGTDLQTLNSIFSIRPAVTTFAEGDTNATVGFVPSGEIIDQGDWIQLDITSLQTGQTRIFVDIFAEPI